MPHIQPIQIPQSPEIQPGPSISFRRLSGFKKPKTLPLVRKLKE